MAGVETAFDTSLVGSDTTSKSCIVSKHSTGVRVPLLCYTPVTVRVRRTGRLAVNFSARWRRAEMGSIGHKAVASHTSGGVEQVSTPDQNSLARRTS